MKFVEIGHIALRAKDPANFEKFYTEVLELPKAFDLTTSAGKVWIRYYQLPSGQFVEVFPGDALPGFDAKDNHYTGENRKCNRSHFHACFEVDARHEAYRDMAKKGVAISHATNDSVGMCGSWCSFITDPEGNEWELMEFSPVSRQLGDQLDNMSYNG
ncbi:MAG: VOC family protein [Gemmiger sp.]|nr:VOC family protein [Gemmiger sp.]